MNNLSDQVPLYPDHIYVMNKNYWGKHSPFQVTIFKGDIRIGKVKVKSDGKIKVPVTRISASDLTITMSIIIH